MKKSLPYLLAINFFLVMAVFSSQAQCRLLSDSVIAGDYIGERVDYSYNASGQLTKLTITDSGFAAGFDSVSYDASGFFNRLDIFFGPNDVNPTETMIYTRNASNQITRVSVTAIGFDAFTVAYDLLYDGSGNLTDIMLDSSSITGNPEPSPDMRNIVWTNGNATSVDLVGDFGSGVDTLEVSATYDDKLNVERFSPPEYDDLLLFFNANNILTVTFDNNEVQGAAGTLVISNSYTYNSDDEVVTFSADSNLFDPELETIQYTYDCSAPVGLVENLAQKEEAFSIYPNPVLDRLVVKAKSSDSYRLRLISVKGEIVHDQFYSGLRTNIDMEQFPSGLYIAEMSNDDLILRKRIIKQ